MAPGLQEVVPTTKAEGPHPSYVQVSNTYVFQQQLSNRLVAIGTNPTREDQHRLQGVQWINDVRSAMQLPVRTFCTAVCYFHTFRLAHKDSDFQFQDAAAAALLTACKIEDTLKKSREILCAAYNLKAFTAADHLSPDDPAFETASKNVIGLERLMLEASGFDFRSRYPQKHIFKLAREAKVDRETTKLAYQIMMDLYKTFSPLKQSCASMSFACIELASLVLDRDSESLEKEFSARYQRWHTSRAEVLETMLDLLELYTHFQKSTAVGVLHHIDKFLNVRIRLNQNLSDSGSEKRRYTEQHDPPRTNGNGVKGHIRTPKTPVTPASPADARLNGVSPATLSPRSAGSGRRAISGRGQEGTIRFMLDAEQAERERIAVDEYLKVEFEEYEVEVEEVIRPVKNDKPSHGPPRDSRHGRDDRYYHHPSKRIRR